MCDFGHSWIMEQPILVGCPLCREKHVTPKPCFSPCFSLSCCMGRRQSSVTWQPRGESVYNLDKLHWCVMETCGYCVTLILAYGDANLGWTSSAHRYGNYTRNVIFRVFGFLSERDTWWTKGETIVQLEPLCKCFMETTVHETELCTFWTIPTFVSGKLCLMSVTWISTQFDHSVSPLDFRSSVHRTLDNTRKTCYLACVLLS